MGVLPAVFVVTGAAVLLWATGCDNMAVTLTPAALAVLLMASDRAQTGTPLGRVLPLALVLVAVSGVWADAHTERIQKEAPCPCRIVPQDDAYALLYYDHKRLHCNS